MDKKTFITQYKSLDAERDEVQRLINNLKRDYLAAYEVQPGDKVRLEWQNGDRETVAVGDLYLNNSTGEIRPLFFQVNADGTAGKTEYKPQRGYSITVLEHGAFRQFVDTDGTPGIDESPETFTA
jgi:hypothetical protein